MSNIPQARTTVPMNQHSSGLHEGHLQLVELAKSVGDRIVVPITSNRNWYDYVIDGTILIAEDTDISKQLKDIESLGAYPLVAAPIEISNEKRIEWRKKAEDVLKGFKEYTLTPYFYRLVLGLTMDLCRQIERSSGKVKYMVRGPELHSFLTKAIKPILGSKVEVIIYPKIVKHPDSGIKLQSGLSRIDSFYYKDIYRLRNMIDGAKDKFKRGLNVDLTKELNSSYKHKPWTIESILNLEGGIIPGALKIIRFEFPAKKGGTVILEDVDYEL